MKKTIYAVIKKGTSEAESVHDCLANANNQVKKLEWADIENNVYSDYRIEAVKLHVEQ